MKFLFAPDLQLASDDRSEGIHHAVGIWRASTYAYALDWVMTFGGQIHLLGKGCKTRTFRVPVTCSSFFSRLAAAKLTAVYFRAPRTGTSHSTSDWRCMPEMGTSRWVPCSPAPAKAMPCMWCRGESKFLLIAAAHTHRRCNLRLRKQFAGWKLF